MLGTSGIRVLLSAALLAVLGAVNAPLYAQFNPDRAYRQSEAVRQHYADPAEQFDTPGFAPGRVDFTSHQEMLEYVYALQKVADNLQVRIAGHSQEGRAIPFLVLSNSGFFGGADLLRLPRPLVFLVGLQHGNEPAGGEAMLVLARELALGSLKPLLDKLTVVIMPHGNPDGAHYFRRSPHGTVDINRDHVKMALPETDALHRVANEFQPHVFIDAHEFSVAARWIEKFGLLQSWDLMVQYATHPAVPAALTDVADRVFLRKLRREVERAGYTHFWYYTTSYNMKDKRVSMGGTIPDIGRNFAGLQNSISFLVESRGVGIGRESFARRVHTHLVAITSLLETTAENAPQVMAAVAGARSETVRRGREARADDLVPVTVKSPLTQQKLTMIHPETGALQEIEVEWSDSLAARPELARRRPYAYLVKPPFHDVARRLALSGVEVRMLRHPVVVEVESYQVTDRRPRPTYVEGLTVSQVTTEIVNKTVAFPAGSYVYLMAQPNANVIAVALEPESPSSVVTYGIVPADKKGSPPTIAAASELPIYRVAQPVELDTRIVERR